MELMSEGQWKRWEVVGRLRAGKLTMAQAALVLALSVRQVRRLRDRVATEGRRALRHRNTGRVPVHALGAGVRTRIVRLRREKYRDFNDAHFAEKLATETPPLRVSVATVRRLLRAAGVPAVCGLAPAPAPHPCRSRATPGARQAACDGAPTGCRSRPARRRSTAGRSPR